MFAVVGVGLTVYEHTAQPRQAVKFVHLNVQGCVFTGHQPLQG